MNLNQTILNECREEVAKEYGYDSWQEVEKKATSLQENGLLGEASELAMEKQTVFFREISGDGWIHEKDETWYKPHDDRYKTELELYNIWREGK